MPENNTRNKKTKLSLYETVCLAMLVALYVVMNRFLSVTAWNINFGFAFAATVTAAALFGVHGGMIVGGLGDFIGAILFPKGAYFPGFTLSAMLIGAIYGLCLKKGKSFWHTALAATVSQIVSSLILNSVWISVLYGNPLKAVIISRLPQFFAVAVFQLILSPIIVKISQIIRKELKIKNPTA